MTPMEEEVAARKAEDFAAEYLRRIEEGSQSDLEEFLSTLPEEVRERCRKEIEQLGRLRGMLDTVGSELAGPPPGPMPLPTDPGQPPSLPGFRIDRLLGEGALGTVYAAWDETLERPVALKILKPQPSGRVRESLLSEARKAAALQDPAIVTIHAVTDLDGHPAIVMERVEGYPIDKAATHLTRRQQAELFRSIARGLALAHRRGIIHRDLKPQNILVTPDLQPKILDFGLALSPAEREETGRFVGTPLYASPEQAQGRRLTAASDIFSLGCVMYTILTGRPPFEGKDVNELLHNIAETDPPFPRNLTSDVPKDLQAICLACMTRDPEQRPTATEVAADLARFRAREPVRLRPALYKDLLRRRVSEHSAELRNWEEQGILSQSENDRLSVVYRRILDDEDPWIFDSRRLSFPQTLLYATTWMVVVASAYLVNFAWKDLTPLARWAFPTWCSVALLAIGLTAYARREVIAAASFLAGSVVAAFPAIVSILAESGLMPGGSGVKQLLDEPFGNERLLVAAGGTLALSLLWLAVMRLTAFAWTTALAVSCTYFAFLLTTGWLSRHPGEQAWELLPLTLLVAPALWLESRGRVRWALPFHLSALVFLVVPLDIMAVNGEHFDLVKLKDAFDDEDTRMYFSLALNGLIFMGLMYVTERAWSLDLRRGASILQLLVPIHLLGSLYANAADNEGWGNAVLYLGAVALLLMLGPWRNRRWFVTGGLSGIALGCFLLIDLDLVDPRIFTVSLCAAAMVAALATHLYLLKRRR